MVPASTLGRAFIAALRSANLWRGRPPHDDQGRARNEPCPQTSSANHPRHPTSHTGPQPPRQLDPRPSPKAIGGPARVIKHALAAGSVGEVETRYLDLPEPERLDCGRVLRPV